MVNAVGGYFTFYRYISIRPSLIMFIFTEKMSLAVKLMHAFAMVTIDSFEIDRETALRLDEEDWV